MSDKDESSSSSSSKESAPTISQRQNTSSQLFECETPEQCQIREAVTALFAGKKRRRESSIGPNSKRFIGDHLGIADNEDLMRVLNANNDEQIKFVDRTSRLAFHSHMSECVCVISEKNIYILTTRLQFADDLGPLPIASIEKVSTSPERDNAVIVHLPDFKTELLMTPNKAELVGVLMSRYQALTGNVLPVAFANVVEFPVNQETVFEVDFIQAVEGVKMTLFCKSAQNEKQNETS